MENYDLYINPEIVKQQFLDIGIKFNKGLIETLTFVKNKPLFSNEVFKQYENIDILIQNDIDLIKKISNKINMIIEFYYNLEDLDSAIQKGSINDIEIHRQLIEQAELNFNMNNINSKRIQNTLEQLNEYVECLHNRCIIIEKRKNIIKQIKKTIDNNDKMIMILESFFNNDFNNIPTVHINQKILKNNFHSIIKKDELIESINIRSKGKH